VASEPLSSAAVSLYLLLDNTGGQLDKRSNAFFNAAKGIGSKVWGKGAPAATGWAVPGATTAKGMAPAVPAGYAQRLGGGLSKLKPSKGVAITAGLGAATTGAGFQVGDAMGNMTGDKRYMANMESHGNLAAAAAIQQMRDLPLWQQLAGAFMSDKNFNTHVRKARPGVADILDENDGRTLRTLVNQGMDPNLAYRAYGQGRTDGKEPLINLSHTTRGHLWTKQMWDKLKG